MGTPKSTIGQQQPATAWTAAEDRTLFDTVAGAGENWELVAQLMGQGKTSEQCLLRWEGFVSPEAKKGNWAPEEDDLLEELVATLGKKWSKFQKHLHGRSVHAIKNRYLTLQKRGMLRGTTPHHTSSPQSRFSGDSLSPDSTFLDEVHSSNITTNSNVKLENPKSFRSKQIQSPPQKLQQKKMLDGRQQQNSLQDPISRNDLQTRTQESAFGVPIPENTNRALAQTRGISLHQSQSQQQQQQQHSQQTGSQPRNTSLVVDAVSWNPNSLSFPTTWQQQQQQQQQRQQQQPCHVLSPRSERSSPQTPSSLATPSSASPRHHNHNNNTVNNKHSLPQQNNNTSQNPTTTATLYYTQQPRFGGTNALFPEISRILDGNSAEAQRERQQQQPQFTSFCQQQRIEQHQFQHRQQQTHNIFDNQHNTQQFRDRLPSFEEFCEVLEYQK